ncbi:MAG: family 43 glycosylhydrolase [Acetatifactor sp.]|nr:family 43 glycosylhydrolase [Acetatifactor sp.]
MKKWQTALLAAALAAGLTGCARTTDTEGGVTAFELAHFDGVSEDGSMDSAYFYKNEFTLYGGDAQILYVSEEQSAEYGGYYYMYNSGSDGVILQNVEGEDPHRSVISCFRSRDLNDWTRCGAVDNGFAVRFEMDEWPVGNCWAPETVYNPEDGRYYMYFSAEANPNPDCEVEYDTDTGASGLTANFDRFFVAICVSDTPVGPFRLLTSENYYGAADAQNLNGKVVTAQNPPINPKFDLGLESMFAIIDTHLFFDDVDADGDGKNDMYLYFVRHVSSDSTDNSIWGMRMKDMMTPDYDSARMLTKPNWRSVEYIADSGLGNFDPDSYRLVDQFIDHNEYEALADKSNAVDKDKYGEEYHVNEGPFVWKDEGRYFLTYSPQGVGRAHYQVRQALGDSPLGSFEKPTLDPATFMGADDTNTSMLGTGHHCLIDGGAGDLYCASWPNATPLTNNINETGRAYAVDRVHFTEDETYGHILCGGPTDSLQPKPYSFTGKVNVAPRAQVTVSGGVEGTEKYLIDEMVVFRSYYADKEFRSEGKTTITLTFPEPVSVSAILIYNSCDYYYAFESVDSILFHLSEKPQWYSGREYVPTAGIFDLPFNREYVNEESSCMKQGGAAVASFQEIMVDSIEITVSKKLSDVRGGEIRISDIVVLGKGEGD